LIGELHDDMGQDRRALAAHEEALALAEAFNNTPGRAKALSGSGLTLHRLGRTDEGLAQLQKARSLFEQTGDATGQMQATNRLGILYVQAGQLDKAIDSFQTSLALSRSLGARETAINLSNLGECHQLLFDMDRALVYHQEAYALAQSTGLRAVTPDVARNLGYDLYYLGHIDEGIGYLQEALQLAGDMLQRDVTMQALYSLAQAEIRRGRLGPAREVARQLQEIVQERNHRLYQAEALYVLGLVEQLEGRPEIAEQRWQEALFRAHESGRQFLLWQIHASLSEIAPNPGLAAVHCQIAADIIHHILYPIEDETMRNAFLSAPIVRRVLERAG
jgi:tetratricopeptide (TPR) repeat protein